MKKAKQGRTKNGSLLQTVFKLAFLAFCVYCLFLIVSAQVDIAEKQQTLSALQQEAQSLDTQNGEYQRILNAEDEKKYMEQLAIGKLGYAYPNEIRFYDVSKN